MSNSLWDTLNIPGDEPASNPGTPSGTLGSPTTTGGDHSAQLLHMASRAEVIPDNIDLDPKASRMIPSDEMSCVGVRLEENGLLAAFASHPSPSEIQRIETLVGMPVLIGIAASPTTFATLRQRSQVINKTQSAICEQILDKALAAGASDVHLAVGAPPKVRVGGHMEVIPGESSLSSSDLEEIAKYLVRGSLLETFPKNKDIDCAATYNGRRLRIALYHQKKAVAAAIRIIPRNILTMEELGMPPICSDIATRNKSGLVLVCGITGSGKSTSLAAMIDVINSQVACHIITVEDPIEYIHVDKMATIHQREIGEDTVSFQTALRHALRQDPDVLLVGEMRDHETMQMAIDAAETGHLVFATVHAREADSVIQRIVSSFPSDQQEHVRTQLANSLTAVIIQKLLPSSMDPTRKELVSEIMIPNDALRNQIRENQLHQLRSTISTSSAEGMQTFDQDIARAVREKRIRREVARVHARNLDDLERYINMA